MHPCRLAGIESAAAWYFEDLTGLIGAAIRNLQASPYQLTHAFQLDECPLVKLLRDSQIVPPGTQAAIITDRFTGDIGRSFAC